MSGGRRNCGVPLQLARMPRTHRIGWSLFLVSAVLFGWAGIRTGDGLVIAGSVVFGLACLLFLAPSGE